MSASFEDVAHRVKTRTLGGRVDPAIRRRIRDRTATVDELEEAERRLDASDDLLDALHAALDSVATQKFVREAITKEDKHVEAVTATIQRKLAYIEERVDELHDPPEHIQQLHDLRMKSIRRQMQGTLGIMVIFVVYFVVQVVFI